MLFGISIVVLLAIFYYYRWTNIQADKKDTERLRELKSLPNYRKLVIILSSEGTRREYFARVLRWDVPGHEEKAELWCVEGPNPNGYTGSFLWDKSDLEFVE